MLVHNSGPNLGSCLTTDSSCVPGDFGPITYCAVFVVGCVGLLSRGLLHRAEPQDSGGEQAGSWRISLLDSIIPFVGDRFLLPRPENSRPAGVSPRQVRPRLKPRPRL